MPEIDFLVLGPTTAERDGEPIPLSGARRRAIVARLLLDANTTVPAPELIEDVWDGSAPAAASATLQSHISQLRKVLGDRLLGTAGGYVLSLECASLDAEEFEQRLDVAISDLTYGDPGMALMELEKALSLWRGRAFQEVADRPWALPEAARLEALRGTAEEQLLYARIAAGELHHVVADAQAAVAREPARENRWAALMIALYRSGRQADSLAAYQQLRQHLNEELGIDPTPAITELRDRILRHDDALDLPATATRRSTVKNRETALEQAGDAAARHDWTSAWRLLVGASAIAPLSLEHLELLGDAAFMAGEQDVSIDSRRQIYARCLREHDPSRAATAALLIVGNHYVRNRPAIAAGWFHKARRLLEAAPESPAHGVLRFTGALIATAQGDLEAAVKAAADAERIGVQFDARDIAAAGRALRGCALIRLGRIAAARHDIDSALEAAMSGGLGPVTTGQIFCWTTQAWLAAGDYDEAGRWIDRIEASGVAGFPGDCRVHRSQLLQALGRSDQVGTEVGRALAEIQNVDLLHVGLAHYELAMIHMTRGRLDDAADELAKAEAAGVSIEPGASLLALGRGDLPGAASLIRAALAGSSQDVLRRAQLLSAAVEIALAAGQAPEADALRRELRAIAHEVGTSGVQALADPSAVRASSEPAGAGGVPSRPARSRRGDTPAAGSKARPGADEAET